MQNSESRDKDNDKHFINSVATILTNVIEKRQLVSFNVTHMPPPTAESGGVIHDLRPVPSGNQTGANRTHS